MLAVQGLTDNNSDSKDIHTNAPTTTVFPPPKLVTGSTEIKTIPYTVVSTLSQETITPTTIQSISNIVPQSTKIHSITIKPGTYFYFQINAKFKYGNCFSNTF